MIFPDTVDDMHRFAVFDQYMIWSYMKWADPLKNSHVIAVIEARSLERVACVADTLVFLRNV